MKTYTLHQLSQQVQGSVIGDANFEIHGVSTPPDASEHQLVFILESRWIEVAKSSKAKAILLSDQIASELFPDKYLIQVSHIRQALASILSLFEVKEPSFTNQSLIDSSADIAENVDISPYTYIGKNVKIASGCKLYPFTYIGDNCQIGANCTLFPQVTLRKNTQLGQHVVIHSGTVIASDGYGYYQENSKHYKIPQIGGVIIQDFVEIGANVTIDRGTVGNTLIGKGTKIDNQVHIGHNVQIGEDCLLVAQVGISGSTIIGDRVTLAGKVGVAGHLSIGNDVVAAGKSGITKDIPSGLKVSGFPAQEHLKELRFQAALRRVPDMFKWWKNFLSGKW